MPAKRYQRRSAGPGRPRKYGGEDLKKFQTATPESTYDGLYELKEKLGVSFSELLTWLVQLANGQIDKLEVLAKAKHLAEALRGSRRKKTSS
ncbi:hypothetical protein [Thermococcus sp. JCM 11816]|uniref:hypothetical protein n=1 Tax=Thermococcus sp. (strain JCM 11816 / KS-1) TaxID=1295125 RepID=UPI0006D0A8F7